MRESLSRLVTALERSRTITLAALVAQIPFEFRYSFAGLSNLQWTFVLLVVVSLPLLLTNWRDFQKDRLALGASLFVAVQWIASFYAPEFNGNAYKAAIRFTAGLLLLFIARNASNQATVLRVWVIASFVAAAYALIAQAGFGETLFRNNEFFVGRVQRLSGSFEYPNVAAAYFAISLALVWRSAFRAAVRWAGALLLWSALILTFSRGSAVAVLTILIADALLTWKKHGEWQRPVQAIVAAVIAAAIITAFSPVEARGFEVPAGFESFLR